MVLPFNPKLRLWCDDRMVWADDHGLTGRKGGLAEEERFVPATLFDVTFELKLHG